MLLNDAAYEAAREILRYRHHPQRLRTNALVRVWAGVALSTFDDAALVRALSDDVLHAVAEMPSRHSALLRRCDLEGEPHASVMRALGLSQRHFYRERRAAILDLAKRLQRSPSRYAVAVKSDRLAFHFARADALERAARTDEALTVLAQLRANAAREDLARIEVRLAEVNRDAGRFEAAFEHAALALCAADTPGVNEELHALSVTIAWQAGNAACNAAALERDIERLRDRARRREPALIPHALSDALEMSAEAALESGNWALAVARFEEAHESLENVTDPRTDNLVRSLIWVATARSWVSGGLPRAARELERAYALACAQTLPREAALALGRLCQILDLGGSTKHALDLSMRHLEPAAAELVGDWRASAHLDVASTYLSAGWLSRAQEQLHHALAAAPFGSFAAAAALMHESEIFLALRDAHGALDSATKALYEMKRLGRSRHVGVTLAVRAEALWMLGRGRQASQQMYEALDLMERYAHPLRLATLYRRAARVTNDRKHARLGREVSHAVSAIRFESPFAGTIHPRTP